ELVTWYGELYFELHRGTYTTQANNKRNNRKAEIMLHDIEYLATLASIRDVITKDGKRYKYPKKDIDDMWENVLLCQFHDCLPGSCIEMCYDDSDELYAKVFKTGKKLLTEALHALGFDDKLCHDNELVALNTLGWNRNEVSSLPSPNQTSRYGLLQGQTGINVVTDMSEMSASVEIKDKGDDVFHLTNSQYFVEISRGVITMLYDKQARREVVPKGQKANQLVIFDDKPLYWQAWDVEVFHLNSRKELHATSSSVISENTP
ncbi:putative alpha-mannosidase I, partial [Aureobasidium melanogenum]